jgi:hypothetical protein
MKKLFFILLVIVAYNKSVAQNHFTFIIKDSTTTEVLPGVNVILDETTNGIASDGNGKGTLNNIPNGEHTIHFTFIGIDLDVLIFLVNLLMNLIKKTL